MRLGVVLFIIPFAFVYYPGLLLHGSFDETLLAVGVTLLATVGIVGGMMGFLIVEVNWMKRFLLMAGGVMIMIPGWRTGVSGTMIILVIGLWILLTKKGKEEYYEV